MAVSIDQFWSLAVQAQLLTPEQVQQLQADFAKVCGAGTGNLGTMIEWLVAEKTISRYQANVLKTGQPGPFTYGDYRVYDRLEGGRLSGLFRAVHVATNQPVCLYFLSGAAAQDPEKYAQTAELTQAAAALRSPHVARVYHLADLQTYRFVVLEDLRGESLKAILGGNGLPAAEACRMARQAALGLAQMHEAGLVHGDVRPENLWLDAKGNVQVLQFPLHRNVLSGPLTLASQRLPSVADYLAPEVVQGATPEPRGDIYSLGCTLYEMLCGRPPFASNDHQQKIARHVSEAPLPAAQANPAVPQPVSDVVGFMLEKDPAARYQHADNVAQALQPYLDPAAASKPAAESCVSADYEAWLEQQPVAGTAPVQPAVAQPLTPQPVPAAQPGPTTPAPVSPAPASPVSVTPVAVSNPSSPANVSPVTVAASAGATDSALPGFTGVATPSQSSGGTATSSIVAARRTQRNEGRKNTNVMIVCGVLLAGILATVLLVMATQDEPPADDGVASNTDGASPTVHVPRGDGGPAAVAPSTGADGNVTPSVGSDGEAAPPETVRQEAPINPLEGDEYWPSPTAGAPLDLRWMPAGVQVFLVLRPADILAHPQGQLLLEGQEPHGPALGPLGSFATSQLQQLCGLPLADVQQVIVGLLGSAPGAAPRVAFVMRTVEPLDLAAWQPRVGNPQRGKLDGKNILIGEELAYYQVDDHTLLGAPAEAISSLGEKSSPFQDALANGEEAAPLRREMEALLHASDSDRLFTALLAPGFLFTGAKTMWQGPAERLKEPIEYFLVKRDHAAKAALASAHMDEDNLFLELRYYGESDVPPRALAEELDKQLREDLPRDVEAYYLKLNNITPHSKRVLYNFPRMIGRLAEYTQIGTDDQHAVARCYLPVLAANSLSYGTYLCTVELPGAGGGPTRPAPPVEKPKTAAEWLAKHKMDLVFPRDNLERTMEMIADEIGIEVRIMGKDLELDGITKNQSFGLDEKNKTVGEILRTVMTKANPDGKLVYVIKQVGYKEVIEITTRAAVAKRGDKLPPELEQN